MTCTNCIRRKPSANQISPKVLPKCYLCHAAIFFNPTAAYCQACAHRLAICPICGKKRNGAGLYRQSEA